MTSLNQPDNYPEIPTSPNNDLTRVIRRLTKRLEQDSLVQQVTFGLFTSLKVDRVVLYYFYRPWKGQVTFEFLSDSQFSILGMTGADDCFNDQYAAMYLEGRVKATENISLEPISDCHREFLESIQVRSNLVVPVLTNKGLWGLLVAHNCRNIRSWSDTDIILMQEAARTLAKAPSIS